MTRLAEEVKMLRASGVFDPEWYARHYGDVPKGIDPAEHYLRIGQVIGRKFANIDSSTQNQIEVIRSSSLFDGDWYLNKYGDVRRAGIDPAGHFFRKAISERRNPSLLFDVDWYLRKYPFLRDGQLNPLFHYIMIGEKLGFERHPGVSFSYISSLRGVDGGAVDSRSRRDPAAFLRRVSERRSISIVVPVYNAPAELDACMTSLRECLGADTRVIAIDDCSPDPTVRDVLKKYHGAPNYCFEANEENLGFTRTVNRGLSMADDDDVIILNADTIVSPGFERRLALAAYSSEQVATVTPMSNNAGPFSIRGPGELSSNSIDEFSRALSLGGCRQLIETPTGHGFCMFIRRAALNDVGMFDAEAFPRGYGEENDFCLRASSAGWSNLIDGTTVIWHAGSASFGESKAELLSRGRKVIDARYPTYTKDIRAFVKSDELNGLCDQANSVLRVFNNEPRVGKKRALFVLPALSPRGGTPQTNRDLMMACQPELETFLLVCDGQKLTLSHVFNEGELVLETAQLSEPIKPFPHRSPAYDRLVSEWLGRYQFDIVHVRHIAWHSLSLFQIAKQFSGRVVYSLHDFYTICPTVKLRDGRGGFCGASCDSGSGTCAPELWRSEDVQPLRSININEWRANFAQALLYCDAFVTTDVSARDLVARVLPQLDRGAFHVIPHGRSFERFLAPKALPADGPMKLLIPGAISASKGAGIVSQLRVEIPESELEIHLLGKWQGPVPSGIVDHGEYDRDSFVEKSGEIGAHLAGIFSVWPETYCHTLTESWASGLPAIVFDAGAQSARVRAAGAGWILDLSNDASSIGEKLRLIRSNSAGFKKVQSAVVAEQKRISLHGVREMAKIYLDVYGVRIKEE